jgi:23S rRNA pseudouridine1911/1915/1917 synthase
MAKPLYIELGEPEQTLRIPILYEDRSVLAIDKPAGWLLVPADWRQTARNLQAALESSIAAGDFWAHSRNLRFLRYVHRLDAETSGALLLIKHPNAVSAFSDLFESRLVEKVYLAVVLGIPRETEWDCCLPLGPDPNSPGRTRVDATGGKPAETRFRVLATRRDPRMGDLALVEALPRTGRTHQIRVHLAQSKYPVVGDPLYSPPGAIPIGLMPENFPLALRAVALAYPDPFTRKRVRVTAPRTRFLEAFGFDRPAADPAAALVPQAKPGEARTSGAQPPRPAMPPRPAAAKQAGAQKGSRPVRPAPRA